MCLSGNNITNTRGQRVRIGPGEFVSFQSLVYWRDVQAYVCLTVLVLACHISLSRAQVRFWQAKYRSNLTDAMMSEHDIVKHEAFCEKWLRNPSNQKLFVSLADKSLRDLTARDRLVPGRGAPTPPLEVRGSVVYAKMLREQRFRCAKTGVCTCF